MANTQIIIDETIEKKPSVHRRLSTRARRPSAASTGRPGLPLNHIDSQYNPHEHDVDLRPALAPTADAGSQGTLPDAEKAIEYPGDLVTFDGPDDPDNPRNWSPRHKLAITMLLGLTTCGSTFTSSIFSTVTSDVSRIYGVSDEVSLLGLSLFVLGFVAGPICFAPLSETLGRRPSILYPYFCFVCLNAASAVSKDLQSLLITRFFAGFFGSAPVSNVGGGLADMYDAEERGVSVVFYSFAVVGGPTLAPLIGSAIVSSGASWRWTQYTSTLFTGTILVLISFMMPETFQPSILTQKAKRLRLQTKNWALHSEQETHNLSVAVFVEKTVTRPLRMLWTEPILTAVCLYNGFAYGVLYAGFASFPIIFQEARGWSPVVASLPFLAELIGIFIAGIINITYGLKVFAPAARAAKGKVAPEKRLPPMCLGSVLFPIGFFWLAWTTESHWINQILAVVIIGCSFLLIFQTGINYLIDSFLIYAASAVAANVSASIYNGCQLNKAKTFIRSIFGAAMPLIAGPMYRNLGIGWATSLLGFISAALAVVPFLFLIYGAKLRSMSRLAHY